ncbi:hypothetical protein CO230_03540 [Chryseobacterium sp. 6424]|nr:hypothetical protein CO230_03540 [Chryseobacterium sp. 6424]
MDQNAEKSKKFSVFSRNSNFAKNGDSLNYAEAFAYLAQRYDAVNITNITGLVNTTNNVHYNKVKKLRFISKNSDAYIEFRLHSQTVFEKNGDLWVLFPKIKDGIVVDLVAGLLTKNETEVYYVTLNRHSSLFLNNLNSFQSRFDQNFKIDEYGNVHVGATSGRCGFPGSPACEIEEVIIVGGGGGGGFSGGLPGDHGSPGGGCSIYIECEPEHGENGGGGDYSDPNAGANDPCTLAEGPSSTATENSKSTAYTNAEAAIVGVNNGLENGVDLGNVNGTIQATGVQTGGTSSINLTSSFSNPIGDIHNHPNNNPPSPGDVYSLMNIRNQFSEYNTRYVITQDGTTYALVVTDHNAMNTFLQSYPPSITLNPNGGNFVDFPPSLFEEWTDLALDFSESGAIAYILNKYNSGITLTKMDGAGNFRAVNITTSQNSDGTTNYNYSLCPN